jgi:hypothetical protein
LGVFFLGVAQPAHNFPGNFTTTFLADSDQLQYRSMEASDALVINLYLIEFTRAQKLIDNFNCKNVVEQEVYTLSIFWDAMNKLLYQNGVNQFFFFRCKKLLALNNYNP